MIKNIEDTLQEKGESFIKNLLSKRVVIFEKITGSSFYFKKIDGNFYFYKKFYDPITKVDRVISKFYEQAIGHIEKLSDKKLKQIPENVYFCFEYIPELSNLPITFDKTPKNNLILISVLDEDKKIHKEFNTTKKLEELSSLLDIDTNLPIFQGYLNSDQKDKILDYFTSESKPETKFSEYFITLLNPDLKSNFLNNEYGDMESFIFIFGDENEKKIYLKALDPVFVNRNIFKINNAKERDDIIKIIFSDLVEFINREKIFWTNFKFKKETFEDKYLELMSVLFITFINDNIDRYKELEFQIPEIFKSEIFKINKDNIPNRSVVDIFDKYEEAEKIFKLFLLLFRKKKKNESEFLNPKVLSYQNRLVDELVDVINGTYTEFSTIKEFIDTLSESNNKDFLEEELYDINEDNDKFPFRVSQLQILLDRNRKLVTPKNDELKRNVLITNSTYLSRYMLLDLEDISKKENKDFIFVFIGNETEIYTKIALNLNYVSTFLVYDEFDLHKIIKDLNKKEFYPNKFFITPMLSAIFLSEYNTINKTYNFNSEVVVIKNSKEERIKLSIENRDLKTFKNDVPEYLHNYFFKK